MPTTTPTPTSKSTHTPPAHPKDPPGVGADFPSPAAPQAGRGEPAAGEWPFVRRVLIVIVAAALCYGLWLSSSAAPLVFAAVLIATLFDWFADLIERASGLPRRAALALAVLTTLGASAGFLAVFGAQVVGQMSSVFERLPQAIEAIGDKMGIIDANAALEEAISGGGGGRSVLTRAASLGYTLLGALGDMALVLFAAIYLAVDPSLYRRGAAKIFPPAQHARIVDAMDVTGAALRLWFVGQLVSMLIVGVTSFFAYLWIGLPSPLALAVIAAVTNFVPYVGPVIGAAPALVFALTLDLGALAWTLAVVIALQQVEGYLLTPLIQSRTVDLPPALALFAILVFGLLFGLAGVLLAAPAAVAALTLVKKLWIRETLGERTSVPGEDAA
jgi:predicted PurR-regulated permease PerM